MSFCTSLLFLSLYFYMLNVDICCWPTFQTARGKRVNGVCTENSILSKRIVFGYWSLCFMQQSNQFGSVLFSEKPSQSSAFKKISKKNNVAIRWSVHNIDFSLHLKRGVVFVGYTCTAQSKAKNTARHTPLQPNDDACDAVCSTLVWLRTSYWIMIHACCVSAWLICLFSATTMKEHTIRNVRASDALRLNIE